MNLETIIFTSKSQITFKHIKLMKQSNKKQQKIIPHPYHEPATITHIPVLNHIQTLNFFCANPPQVKISTQQSHSKKEKP